MDYKLFTVIQYGQINATKLQVGIVKKRLKVW